MSDHKAAPTFNTVTKPVEKKKVRDHFLITGPSFAGKTKLYYKLMGGDIGESVSSSDVNITAGTIPVKVPNRLLGRQTEEGESAYAQIDAKFVDVPGHYNFKKTMQEESSGAKAVIVLLDSKDKSRFGEAAEVIYDLLGDIEIVSQEVPILVACNKQDIAFAKNPLQIERELATEIDQIRKVRKATLQ